MEEPINTTTKTRSSPTNTEAALQLPPLPKTQPAKPGTILSFFKPVSASFSSSSAIISDASLSKTSSDCITVELEEENAAETPPSSSPPQVSKARKRRRLTTRPEVGRFSVGMGESHDDNHELEEEAARDQEYEQNDEDSTSSTVCSPTRSTSNVKGNNEPSPIRAIFNAAGSMMTSRKTLIEGGLDGQKRRQRRKQDKKELVQTTLSLSINRDSGYVVCKDCGLLYNPVHEKDRKEHAREHAAHQRRGKNRDKRA
jgi:hypothetical protein